MFPKILTIEEPAGGGGAPSSDPAPSPTSVPSAEPVPSGDEAPFDFASLTVDDRYTANDPPSEKPVVPASPVPPADPGIVPPASAAVPPSTGAPASQPGQQPGQPPTAAPEQPAPAATAQEPPAPPAEPVDWEKHRKEFLPKLTDLYKLTDQEAESLRTEPEKVYPAMAARLHYEVQAATYNSLLQVLPQIVSGLLESRQAADQADTAFYSSWPKLSKTEKSHTEAIRNSIRAYRNANPKADMGTVIKNAGLMAMMSLGLPLDLPGAPVPLTTPLVPSAPPRPAGAGGTGHVPRPAGPGGGGSDNVFTDLANDVLAGRL